MNQMRPGPLMMLGGGVLMVIGSILDWRGFSIGGFGSSVSGLNFDSMGLFGLLTLLFGLAIAAVGGIIAFAPQVKLPAEILGFTPLQEAFALALTVFLWTFALISADFVEFGVHLTWIGAAVAGAGSVIELQTSPTSSPSAI